MMMSVVDPTWARAGALRQSSMAATAEKSKQQGTHDLAGKRDRTPSARRSYSLAAITLSLAANRWSGVPGRPHRARHPMAATLRRPRREPHSRGSPRSVAATRATAPIAAPSTRAGSTVGRLPSGYSDDEDARAQRERDRRGERERVEVRVVMRPKPLDQRRRAREVDEMARQHDRPVVQLREHLVGEELDPLARRVALRARRQSSIAGEPLGSPPDPRRSTTRPSAWKLSASASGSRADGGEDRGDELRGAARAARAPPCRSRAG